MALSSSQIDSLPECLILLIFSFLPAIDAIRASLVCWKWRNLWHHVPSLNFDIVSYHSPSNPYPQTRESFTKLFKRALHVRPPNPLRKLYIRIDCDSVRDRRNVRSWIDYAVKCGVRELDLDLFPCDLNTSWPEFPDDEEYFRSYVDYCFHFSSLMDCPIEDLKFRRGSCCDLPLLPSNGKSAMFTSLHSLTLDDVSFNSGEDFIRLVQNCTNLEHLTMVNCYGMRDLRIVSSRLKTCKISSELETVRLVITSPCLHSIFLSNVFVQHDLMNGCPNLIKLELNCEERYGQYYAWWCEVLKLLTWIKCTLVVQNMYFLQTFPICALREERLPSCNFYNLSHLEVHTGYGFNHTELRGICSFLKNVPALEQLVLDHCYWGPWNIYETPLPEDLMSNAISLHIPRLERVKMKNYRATIGERYVLELLKTHGVVLKEVVAFPVQSGDKWSKPWALFLSP